MYFAMEFNQLYQHQRLQNKTMTGVYFPVAFSFKDTKSLPLNNP